MLPGELHEYSAVEVSRHKSADDCWLILGEEGRQKVYDITAFLESHPGGPEILLDLAGQDAHEEFKQVGHSNLAQDMVEQLCIGRLRADGRRKTKRGRVVLPMASNDHQNKGIHESRLVPLMIAFMVCLFAYLIYP
ncbi:cytochrome b5 [Thraustotheca clavata]|uniref:Cytochrome b5 n=1 Tax=Thraustotheca clavata TaxID=74557 RepID=A0A1W0A4V6_9STRA|nr:cytochrome b5 [Thraustotheca clavata]